MSAQGTHKTDFNPNSHLSLFEQLKVLLRLGPKQIRDELRLAQSQLKSKGIDFGIGAGLMVVALGLLALMGVALVVLVVALFAQLMPWWAAALVTAGIFLLLGLVLVLFGLGKVKAAMPLVPKDAIRGLQYDLGVLREGRAFNPREFDREQRRKSKEKEQEKRRNEQTKSESKPAVEAPSHYELLQRTAARREHIAQLRDGALTKVGIDPKMPNKKGNYSAESTASEPQIKDRDAVTAKTMSTHTGTTRPLNAAELEDPKEKAKYIVQQRWQDLAVAGASSAAFVVFVKKLFKQP